MNEPVCAICSAEVTEPEQVSIISQREIGRGSKWVAHDTCWDTLTAGWDDA